MSSRSILLVALALGGMQVQAQNTRVILRNPLGGQSCHILKVDNSGPPQTVTCAEPHGFHVGDLEILYNVQGTDTTHGWCANGIRKVASTPTATTFTIQDQNGLNIPLCGASGPDRTSTSYYAATNVPASYYAYAAPAASYRIRAHPVVYLDGPGGPLTAGLSDAKRVCPRHDASCTEYQYVTYRGIAATSNLIRNNYANELSDAGGEYKFAGTAIKWIADGSKAHDRQLTVARWLINNPDMIFGGSVWCDLTVSQCGKDLEASLDYSTFYVQYEIAVYEALYPQLTTTERQAFANYLLNGPSLNGNGLGVQNDPRTDCTLPPVAHGVGTISGSGTTITGVGTDFGTSIHSGQIIYEADVNGHPLKNLAHALVLSVQSPIRLTIDRRLAVTAGTHWAYSRRWQQFTHDCGAIWYMQHNGIAVSNSTAGVGAFGEFKADNKQFGVAAMRMAVGLSLCDQDERGCLLASLTSAFWFDQLYAEALANWGHAISGTSYNITRTEQFAAEYIQIVRNSLPDYPDLRARFEQDFINEFVFDHLLYPPYLNSIEYGMAADTSLDLNGYAMTTLLESMQLHSTSPEAKYAAYWLTHVANYPKNPTSASHMRWKNYIDFDPYFWSRPANELPLSGLPQQFIFRPHLENCSIYSVHCYNWAYPYGSHSGSLLAQDSAISRHNGWAPNSDVVQMDTFAFQVQNDHGSTHWCPGCLRIWGPLGPLEAGDHKHHAGSGFGTGAKAGENQYADNLIEVGGTIKNFASGINNCPLVQATPAITRWATVGSSRPDYGDPSSRFAAWMADLTPSYCSYSNPTPRTPNIQRALKYVIHFKKSGAQDYVVTDFDGAVASGSPATYWREFVVFRTADDSGRCYLGGGVPACPADKVTSTSSSDFRDDATTVQARINERIIALRGANSIYTATPVNSSFPGTAGTGARIEIDSSTDGKSFGTARAVTWIRVIQPCADSTCALPPTRLDASSTHDVVEIQDSIFPKVAAFPKGGQLYNSVSFTTTFSGTGQYVVQGMSPGTYNCSIGRVSSPCNTVLSGDNTLYFEGGSGAVTLSLKNGPNNPIKGRE